MKNNNRVRLHKNIKGMTVVELLISAGLVATLALVLGTAQILVAKSQLKITEKVEQSTEKAFAEKVIYSDLSNIDPSYNNLRLLDDSSNNFFDFYPDISAAELGNTKRKILLSMSGNLSKEILIMSQDPSLGPLLIYDPVAAYTVGSNTTNWNTSATLTWVGLNKGGWLSTQRPNFWSNGVLLMMDSPARVRPVDSSGLVSMKTAPRSPAFFGVVSGASTTGGNLNKVSATFANLLNFNHPETGASIATPDSFLKTVPSVGGGQSFVRLRAIKFTKYYLEKTTLVKEDCVDSTGKRSVHGNLVRKTYDKDKGDFSAPFVLATNVCSFELSRDSVLNKMVSFKISQVTSKDNAN